MLETRALGSAPDIFRNFGSGATVVALTFSVAHQPGGFGFLQLANQIVAVFPAVQFAISAGAIFIFYVIGAACTIFGETVFAIFPWRFAEREVELEVAIIRSRDPVLMSALHNFEREIANLHTAVGVGAFTLVGGIGSSQFSLGATQLFVLVSCLLVAFVAGLRRVWITQKFHVILHAVMGGTALTTVTQGGAMNAQSGSSLS